MKKYTSLLIAGILGSVFTLGAYQIFFANPLKENTPTLLQQPLQGAGSFANYMTKLPTTLPDFTIVAENTVNAVVHIKTTFEQRTTLFDEYFGMPDVFRDFFFGPRGREPQQRPEIVATGSGVIIRQDGYILTNNHVVADAIAVEVTLNDNRVFDARIIGTDPSTDLALIKIEQQGLPFLAFGDSDKVRVGEWVLAVGNPFNLTSTVTAGIVSALGRNINILGGGRAIESFIQTDAAVNRGNSGGALVNSQGQLIGINTAIASQTGSFAGYSFAIPSNLAAKVLSDLIEFGNVQRGMLGVGITTLNSRQAQELGLSDFKGAYVQDVVQGSAAYRAGLKQGDLITGIDQTAINNASELTETIGRRRPGEEVRVRYIRDGKAREATAKLQNELGEYTTVESSLQNLETRIGASFETVSSSDLNKLNIRNGVRVTNVRRNGQFQQTGIEEGYIIVRIDRQPVNSPEDVMRRLAGNNDVVLLEGVYPNGNRASYALDLSR